MDTGPTASTDIHPSSWRTWRPAHVRVYEYIYIYMCIFFFFGLFSYVNSCYGEKHSADTHQHTQHPPPPPHCLVKPLRREGRPDPPGLVPSRQPFFCYTGPSDLFLQTLCTNKLAESTVDRREVQPHSAQSGAFLAPPPQPAAISSPGVKSGIC